VVTNVSFLRNVGRVFCNEPFLIKVIKFDESLIFRVDSEINHTDVQMDTRTSHYTFIYALLERPRPNVSGSLSTVLRTHADNAQSRLLRENFDTRIYR
jgi:hypothetical protein